VDKSEASSFVHFFHSPHPYVFYKKCKVLCQMCGSVLWKYCSLYIFFVLYNNKYFLFLKD